MKGTGWEKSAAETAEGSSCTQLQQFSAAILRPNSHEESPLLTPGVEHLKDAGWARKQNGWIRGDTSQRMCRDVNGVGRWADRGVEVLVDKRCRTRRCRQISNAFLLTSL